MNQINMIPGILSVFIITLAFPPAPGNKTLPGGAESREFKIMFYNVENLFDPANDSLTGDDDFTPSGDLHWTYKRYYSKINKLYKVITALGGWQPPDIIGLCEVENKKVLLDMIHNTPLSKFPYDIIHYNSPDKRGIDVALLYNRKTIRLLSSKKISLRKNGLFTRDILHVKAILHKDTCHFLVNHWPSRSAGQIETEGDRNKAALLLKSFTDSLFAKNMNASIIIMGDFNDEPVDESLSGKLMARTNMHDPKPGFLYNVSVAPSAGNYRGTLKYRGQWNLFDQIIVSGSLLYTSNGLRVQANGYKIFGESFLLIGDEQYTGFKPFRTYNGFRYQGGFSDHLPVYVVVTSNE
ncbi:MAG TPA: endonuclease/exonuclease/phosphatase family protein [Bacteroidales bacterium]|nr:endonuclease/exonuclease/phosphatase family protein [Bacteroidales bacterium]